MWFLVLGCLWCQILHKVLVVDLCCEFFVTHGRFLSYFEWLLKIPLSMVSPLVLKPRDVTGRWRFLYNDFYIMSGKFEAKSGELICCAVKDIRKRKSSPYSNVLLLLGDGVTRTRPGPKHRGANRCKPCKLFLGRCKLNLPEKVTSTDWTRNRGHVISTQI